MPIPPPRLVTKKLTPNKYKMKAQLLTKAILLIGTIGTLSGCASDWDSPPEGKSNDGLPVMNSRAVNPNVFTYPILPGSPGWDNTLSPGCTFAPTPLGLPRVEKKRTPPGYGSRDTEKLNIKLLRQSLRSFSFIISSTSN